MSTGARSTDQWREHRALLEAIQRGAPAADPAPPPPAPEPEVEPDSAPFPMAQRIGAIAIGVLALLWLAAFVTSFQPEAAPVAALAARISLASGPLALLGIAYLLLQRTSRREARRFGRTAAAMRAEAASLDATIARLAERIDDNRKSIAEHGKELLALGEDSALRLAELGATMRAETIALTRNAERLEAAATTAFADMGVMVADLPAIEAQVHALAGTLRETGREANEQVATLSAELVSLGSRAREVDEVAGGAAQRLAAHLARIEGTSDAAGSRIDAAAAGMARTVDVALSGAAEAIDATRAGIDAQSAALLAMVEQGKAAFALAGSDAAASLEARLQATIAQADRLGERLGRHDEAGRALLAMLTERVEAIDTALAQVDATGTARANHLADTLRAVGDVAGTLGGTIERNGDAAEALVARGDRLRAVLAACSADLDGRLPALFVALEEGATRGGDAIGALVPQADALAAGVTEAGNALARIDALLAGQRRAIDAIGAAAGDQLAGLAEQAGAVEALLGDTAEQARALTGSAAPQLVEALLRVRETANQAAEHAGRAFGEVIRRAAFRLGQESSAALDAQLGQSVDARLAAIATASDRAVEAAQSASRRLTEEMAAIEATSSAVEARLAEAREAELANREDAVSSRVARLIEELNSIGIDVTKLLASDTPDTLWAGYLKGDRSIFTRRAARLVDAAEAREIARRYEEQPPFRDQVNRYIHDFEAMLRHVLAIRDGSLLGVTLLSSDMGKLYVALAQAIERLRS